MSAIKAFINRHSLAAYFALAFAISWGGVLLVIGGPGGIPGTAARSDPLFPFVYLAMLAGPSVAGILVALPCDLVGKWQFFRGAFAGPLPVRRTLLLPAAVPAAGGVGRFPDPGRPLVPVAVGSFLTPGGHMQRILIVYFSRGSNTRRVAEHLAVDLRADLEEIVDKASRSGVFGYQRSGFQAFFRRLAPIAPPAHDPGAYDLVVVATPIWDMSLSSLVRSYLRRHRSALPIVAFFCTCGGVGSERVFRQMTEESGREPVARLVVTEHDLAVPATPIAIARFAVHIRAVLVNAPNQTSATRAIAGARR